MREFSEPEVIEETDNKTNSQETDGSFELLK